MHVKISQMCQLNHLNCINRPALGNPLKTFQTCNQTREEVHSGQLLTYLCKDTRIISKKTDSNLIIANILIIGYFCQEIVLFLMNISLGALGTLCDALVCTPPKESQAP